MACDIELETLAREVGEYLRGRQLLLVTAEACTGGWIGSVVTAIAGSSKWFERGFVTYSNASKIEMLGVREATLMTHGSVSEATVREMAEGALARSDAQVSVAISGVAGPGGGVPEKPVGTVWMAWGRRSAVTRTACHQFAGDRQAVRRHSVLAALRGVMNTQPDD